jgi:hypothetical protein
VSVLSSECVSVHDSWSATQHGRGPVITELENTTVAVGLALVEVDGHTQTGEANSAA